MMIDEYGNTVQLWLMADGRSDVSESFHSDPSVAPMPSLQSFRLSRTFGHIGWLLSPHPLVPTALGPPLCPQTLRSGPAQEIHSL